MEKIGFHVDYGFFWYYV